MKNLEKLASLILKKMPFFDLWSLNLVLINTCHFYPLVLVAWWWWSTKLIRNKFNMTYITLNLIYSKWRPWKIVRILKSPYSVLNCLTCVLFSAYPRLVTTKTLFLDRFQSFKVKFKGICTINVKNIEKNDKMNVPYLSFSPDIVHSNSNNSLIRTFFATHMSNVI